MFQSELQVQRFSFHPGDVLVLYTDGVTEAMNASHDQFGQDRLETALRASEGASAEGVLDTIVKAIRSFTGDIPQSDDLTLFVVRRGLPEA